MARSKRNDDTASAAAPAPLSSPFEHPRLAGLTLDQIASLDLIALMSEGTSMDDMRIIGEAYRAAVKSVAERQARQRTFKPALETVLSVDADDKGYLTVRLANIGAATKFSLVDVAKLLRDQHIIREALPALFARLRVEDEADVARVTTALASIGVEVSGSPTVGPFPAPVPRKSKEEAPAA